MTRRMSASSAAASSSSLAEESQPWAILNSRSGVMRSGGFSNDNKETAPQALAGMRRQRATAVARASAHPGKSFAVFARGPELAGGVGDSSAESIGPSPVASHSRRTPRIFAISLPPERRGSLSRPNSMLV